MYITVSSVSYRYIVHHNIITLRLYTCCWWFATESIDSQKKKKERTIHNTQTRAHSFSHIIQYDCDWTVTLVILVCRFQLYVQKRYVYSTISMLFISIIIYARLQWARTYLFPPLLLVIFRSPIRWLLSSSFSSSIVRSNYDIRYFFFPSLTQRYAISIRHVDSERVSFLLSLFLSFPLIFLLLRKLGFHLRFRLADEKDRFGKSRERNAAWNGFEENEQLEEAISSFISSSFSFFLFLFPLLDEKQKDLFYLITIGIYTQSTCPRFEACLACLILPYLIRRNGLDNFT